MIKKIGRRNKYKRKHKNCYFVKIFLLLLFFIVNKIIKKQSIKSKQRISHKIIYKQKIFNRINTFKNLSFSSLNISDLTLNKNLTKLNHKYKIFAIIRKECNICGLFSFYIFYLGCATQYINLGYIPIIDLKTHPNIYNGFNTSINYNPWELFFEQPYGYKMDEVLQKEKNIVYIKCIESIKRPEELDIYYHKDLIKYWHNLGKKYIPIKREIIKESNFIMKNLFNNSKNVLGVKIRGTDYIKLKPKGHPKPPNIEDAVQDVKKMYLKNKYDWIFFASEDEKIKERFINEFKNKIKYLNSKQKINYTNYYFVKNKNVCGNVEYSKNYVMNIYILSKCIDIVMTRGSGGAGIILLTEGFRNSLIYNLGEY